MLSPHEGGFWFLELDSKYGSCRVPTLKDIESGHLAGLVCKSKLRDITLPSSNPTFQLLFQLYNGSEGRVLS